MTAWELNLGLTGNNGVRTNSVTRAFLLVVLSTPCLLPGASAHGRLLEPPSRSSMWRFGYDTPKNYDDNQLFCGGKGIQYSPGVDGRCGVCGDPWNGPRQNEPGGKYANGIIVRKYAKGQVINITVELTANHKGFFEFRLCPSKSPFAKVTQDCLDRNLLIDASSGRNRYLVSDKGYRLKFQLRFRLPNDLSCRACLLQWTYTAGNSWGKSGDGDGCIGCGNQEQFYGCSDIAIGHDEVVLGKPVGKNPWIGVDKGGDSGWDFGVHKDGNETHHSGSGNTITSHPVINTGISFIVVFISTLIIQNIVLA